MTTQSILTGCQAVAQRRSMTSLRSHSYSLIELCFHASLLLSSADCVQEGLAESYTEGIDLWNQTTTVVVGDGDKTNKMHNVFQLIN